MIPKECIDPKSTPNDRVAAYFKHLTGVPMTREAKVVLNEVIYGEQ